MKFDSKWETYQWWVFGSEICRGEDLCGFRPTGRLHVGHYFAVIKPGQNGASVLVATYHAPFSVTKNVEVLEKFNVKKILFQEKEFLPELYFSLLAISKIGDLSRMTQFKSAKEEDRTGHLMTYPVLMAHDVAGYKNVLVGEDQEQHLQYARKLLSKFNQNSPTKYAIPVAKIVSGRIKDLRDPSKKMSKSSPDGCLFLDDSSEQIRAKIKRATADEAGLNNLKFLYNEFVGEVVPEQNQKLKERLADCIVNTICK